MKEVFVKNINFDIRKFKRDCVSNLQTADGKQIWFIWKYNIFSKFPITLGVLIGKNKEVKIHYTKYGEPNIKDLPNQTCEEFEKYKLVIRKFFVDDGEIIKFVTDKKGVTGLAMVRKQSKNFFDCYYFTGYYNKFFRKFYRGEWTIYNNPHAGYIDEEGYYDLNLILWEDTGAMNITHRYPERLANETEKKYFLYMQKNNL